VDTVVVTGGAGFIGSHVCDRLLTHGLEVVAVDDLSTGREANLDEARQNERFFFYTIDIRHRALGEVLRRHRPRVVMHLAAQSRVRESVEDPYLDASINIMGLLNVMRLSHASGVKKIVFASSGGTIFGLPKVLPASERTGRGSHPVSPYGISKKVAESYLRFYRRSRGLDFTSLALANVYGPRQDPHGEAGVVAIFTAKLLSGQAPTIFGDGMHTRDYVFVDDVADAFVRAIDQASGKLLNIGTGIETSVNDIYRILARMTSFGGTPLHDPLPEGEVERSCLDASHASREMGWKPWVGLQDGLGRTVRSFASLPGRAGG
jgi:UDP-glucose 4-epimerase